MRQSESKVITIYDIAKEAGVSPATVSRVLTNNANVRPEKKKRVLQLIEKYNFKPNALARGLSDTRSKTIGIMAADVRNPFYAEVFVACEAAARRAGYTVLLYNSLGKKQQEEALLEKLREQRVDAVIQLGGSADDLQSDMEYVEKVNLETAGIPMVVTGKLDGTQCYQVQIDAMKAVEILMEYLISLGHERIAMVGGAGSVLSTFEKMQRYKQILAIYKMEFRAELVRLNGGYDFAAGYKGMNRMLKEGHIPTAVIAINDFAATGIMRSIAEHGLRIPEDISVVSYDNTYICELMMPKLTSVDYNYEAFGEKLVETAIAAVEGKDGPRALRVKPSLVIRESSAAAPGFQKAARGRHLSD